MPEYERELRALAENLGLRSTLMFLGDCPDVPRLLSGLDIFVWLSQGEGMPHVISEAGAAKLPVISTRDNGTEEQITDGETGLFVPHRDPSAVAAAIQTLTANPVLRQRLGSKLHRKVAREYSATTLIPLWEMLFDELCASCRLPGQ
jgi:polysaccharide biosynthesis protein PelF